MDEKENNTPTTREELTEKINQQKSASKREIIKRYSIITLTVTLFIIIGFTFFYYSFRNYTNNDLVSDALKFGAFLLIGLVLYSITILYANSVFFKDSLDKLFIIKLLRILGVEKDTFKLGFVEIWIFCFLCIILLLAILFAIKLIEVLSYIWYYIFVFVSLIFIYNLWKKK